MKRGEHKEPDIKLRLAEEAKPEAPPTTGDPVVLALQAGLIPFGNTRVPIDAPRDEVARLTGIPFGAPVKGWQDRGVAWQIYEVPAAVLWYPRGPRAVSLGFMNDALHVVSCVDPGWQSTGSSWDDYDPEIEIQNYQRTRSDLVELLGPPDDRFEDVPGTLFVEWHLPAMKLRLCYESRTPDCTVTIESLAKARRGPRRKGGKSARAR